MKCLGCVLTGLSLVGAASADGFIVERKTFEADRHDVSLPAGMTEAERKDFTRGYGWAEVDVDVPRDGWYELAEQWGANTRNGVSNIHLDGRPFKMAFRPGVERNRLQPASVNPYNPWLKEANLFLEKGRHVIRFERTHFAGGLSWSWRLTEATNAQQTVSARLDYTAFPAGEPVKLTVTGGWREKATTYDILFADEVRGRTNAVGRVSFPATERPVTKEVTIVVPQQTEAGYLLAQAEGGVARPADLGLPLLTAIDRRTAEPTESELKLTLVADVDCVKTAPYREKDGVTRIVEKPFGSYREMVPTNLPYKSGWALDAFSYAIQIPDADHTYKLVVDYPDDDFRSIGFWTNDGTRNHFEGRCMTGGVETGIEYRNTQTMQRHEAFFFSQKTNLVVAAVNLNVGSRAAAARVRVYRVDGPLPAAKTGARRGRLFGNGFEEFGRWKWHFGMRPASGDRDCLENIRSMERWLEWNRFAGANFIQPTVSAYNFTEYPSLEQKGTAMRAPLNAPRILALLADKYGNKFMPHLQVEYQEDCVGASNGVNVVFTEKKGVHGRRVVERVEVLNEEAEGYVLVDRHGNRHCAKSPMEPFIFNPLHPRVQEKYIRIVGEVADLIGDTESFAGISIRVPFGWHFTGWNAFHGLDYGYEDWTIREFERDTGIKVPGEAGDPKRFEARYKFLVHTQRERWMKWRQARMYDYYKRLLARIRAVKPSAKLHVAIWGHFKDLPEKGLDLELFRGDEGFVFTTSDAGLSYGHRHFSLLDNAKRNDQMTNPDSFRSANYGFRASSMSGGYYEPNGLFDWTQVGGTPYGAFDQCRPGGVNELQGFAVALKRCDPCLMINFGSGWMFGTPELEVPFLREYLALPTERFSDSPVQRDPVVLRELRTEKGLWVYALNMLDSPVKVRLAFEGAGRVTSAVTGRESSPDFTLGAYGLRAFFVTDDAGGVRARLADMTVDYDREPYAVYYRAASAVADLRERLVRREILVDATEEDCRMYLERMDAVREAAAAGRTAELRDLLFGYALTYVFEATGEFPEGLVAGASRIGGYPAWAADFREPQPVKVIGGDPLARNAAPMAYLETSNRVYAVGRPTAKTTSPRVVEFDREGRYLRTPRVTGSGRNYLMGGLSADSNNKLIMPAAPTSFEYRNEALIQGDALLMATRGDYVKAFSLEDFRERPPVPRVNVTFPPMDTRDRGWLTHEPNPLREDTQLVVHEGRVWFIGQGKLKRLDPRTDEITDVMDARVAKDVSMAAFAFTESGDLVVSCIREGGVRLYRAARQGEAFGPFTELTTEALAPWWTSQPCLLALKEGVVVRTGGNDSHDFGLFTDGKVHPLFGLGRTRRNNSYRCGVTVCRDGSYVVAGGGSHSVTRYNADWTIRWRRRALKSEAMDSLSLGTPTAVAEDAKGNLWLVDAGREQLVCLDADGNFRGTFGHSGTIDNRSGKGFANPTGIAIVGDSLYVADAGNQRLIKYTLKENGK